MSMYLWNLLPAQQARVTLFRGPVRLPGSKLHVRSLSLTATVKGGREEDAKPFSEIPGPKLSIAELIMGAVFGAKKEKRNLIELHHRNARTYGKLVRISFPLGIPPMLLLADPDALEVAYRNIGSTPYRPGFEHMTEYLRPKGTEPGLIWSQEEGWQSLRSRVNKQILPQRVAAFAPLLSEVALEFVNHLKEKQDRDEYINDIYQPLVKWAFEGISVFILNKRLNMLSNPTAEMIQFQDESLHLIQGLAYMAQSIPVYKFIPTRQSRRFMKAIRFLDSISVKFIEERKAALSNLGTEQCIGFLDQWLVDGKLTAKEIIPLVRDFLAAGVDTTSSTATFMLHELAKHPEVQERLHEEVTTVLGAEDVPDGRSYQRLTFAKCIIKEALRYHSVVPGVPTTVNRDVVLAGYHVPAGTRILSMAAVTGMDPQSFERPDEFLPERWLREDSSSKHHPFSFTPFGFGPRACYGRRLAELELTMLLVQMSRRFVLSTDQDKLEIHAVGVTKPQEDVRLCCTSRV